MLLDVREVHKRYGKVQVLRGASLRVERGEAVGLVGENGSGKSTLLRIVVGLLRADQGSVQMNARCGYCPQEPLVFDGLTMEENIVYFGAAYGLSRMEARRRGYALMERLNCRQYSAAATGTLSGGTKQKLNLILALLHNPALLILDEPYQGFDYESYEHFWELSQELISQGRSVLVVSHMMVDRKQLSRVYELTEGKAIDDHHATSHVVSDAGAGIPAAAALATDRAGNARRPVRD